MTNDPNRDPDPVKPHWVVDKRLNIANLLAFVGMAVAAVVAFNRLEGDVSLNRENIVDNQEAIIAVESRQNSALFQIERRQNDKFVEIKRFLTRIEDKLDRKADK